MKNLPISDKLQKLITQEMEAGGYSSCEELIAKALTELTERRQAIEGIARGLADVKAGRVRSWRKDVSTRLNEHRT